MKQQAYYNLFRQVVSVIVSNQDFESVFYLLTQTANLLTLLATGGSIVGLRSPHLQEVGHLQDFFSQNPSMYPLGSY